MRISIPLVLVFVTAITAPVLADFTVALQPEPVAPPSIESAVPDPEPLPVVEVQVDTPAPADGPAFGLTVDSQPDGSIDGSVTTVDVGEPAQPSFFTSQVEPARAAGCQVVYTTAQEFDPSPRFPFDPQSRMSSVVPEPSSILGLAAGLGLVIARFRKRR